MIGPIGHGGFDALQLRNAAVEEIAETFSRHVDIFAVAIDEIHRHRERVIDITLEPHAVFEHPWQHAGTRIVDIGPDLAAQ